MQTETLTYSKNRLARLKDKYAKAKEAGLEGFYFDGYDLLLSMSFIYLNT
tara:strand:- start:324 stop:473 length:150 start_codon:yes stop_codon:yes gene_type:complete